MRIHKFSGRISICQTRHRLLLDRSPKLRFSFQSLGNALFSTFLELKKKVNSVEVIVLTALEGKKRKNIIALCATRRENTQYLTQPQTGNMLLSHLVVHSPALIQKFHVVSTTTVPQKTDHSPSLLLLACKLFSLPGQCHHCSQFLLSCLFLLFAGLIGIYLHLGIFKNS